MRHRDHAEVEFAVLILGAAEPAARPRLFRQLLTYGLVSIVVAPVVAWLTFGSW